MSEEEKKEVIPPVETPKEEVKVEVPKPKAEPRPKAAPKPAAAPPAPKPVEVAKVAPPVEPVVEGVTLVVPSVVPTSVPSEPKVPTIEEAIEKINQNPQPTPVVKVKKEEPKIEEPKVVELKPEVIEGKEMAGNFFPSAETLVAKVEEGLGEIVEELSFHAKKWYSYLKLQNKSPEWFLNKYPTHKFKGFVEEIIKKTKKK